MKIKPLFDRIVLKQVSLTNDNSSGLIFLENSQEKPLIGEIVEVGDGILSNDEKQKMVVKKGDKVLFSKYAGNAFKLNHKDFIIIRQADILAVVEE